MAKDYGKTLNLPKTDFSMRANLPQREPATQEKWAVENVINTYFGDGYLEEWFQYGGEPGRFRIYSANPTLNESKFAEFINILNKVKRASSQLDGVFITLTGQMNMSAGVALHEYGTEQYSIGGAPLV